MTDLSALEQRLGVAARNPAIFEQALTHRSYLNENPDSSAGHNERLEFLGDAVLELIVTDSLYLSYPDRTEGELTAWRAALVNSKMLAQVAKEIDLGSYLLLSKGEARENGRGKDYILANAFEALMGALYLDQGLKTCEDAVRKLILPKLPEIIEKKLFQDYKSRLQEEAQERASVTPTYDVLREWGPDHAKRFLVGAYLGRELAGKGEGSSKQEAESEAAKNALEQKGWE